jgi:DNA repair exonuclease SbcCD ATPase subunit
VRGLPLRYERVPQLALQEGKFRISELAAEVDGAKGTITILQLCIGVGERLIQSDHFFALQKLVNEKAALAAQIEKLLQESDVRKHLAQEDEAQKHRMQEFIVRQEQELRAAKGFSKAYQQDAERYKKKLGRLNQERKADMSICKQEADMLRHELHETKQQVLAGPSLQQAVAELRAQVASQHAALQAGKAREAKLAAELSHANASTSAEHRARSEVERELGKMSRDQYDARKASLLPPAGKKSRARICSLTFSFRPARVRQVQGWRLAGHHSRPGEARQERRDHLGRQRPAHRDRGGERLQAAGPAGAVLRVEREDREIRA